MSKRKRPTSKKFRERYPRIKGNFYRRFDSKGGHPARVYHSDPLNDTYFIQRFSRHGRKDRKRLKHNIDPSSQEEQWLIKIPEAVGYDDMAYDANFTNYRIHPDDEKTIVKYQKYDLKKKNR